MQCNKGLSISAQIALEKAAKRFDVRCLGCNKLLGRINGIYEIKCPRCGAMNTNKVKESVEDGE